MFRTTKLAYLVLLIAAVQTVSARIATKSGESEFGRIAGADEFMNMEVAEEDQVFWFRALQSSMSMSMSMSMDLGMSMPMEPVAAESMDEEVPVDGATGESSAVTTAAEPTETTTEEVVETPFEPLDTEAAVDDSQSSAAKKFMGLTCVVGVMGMLLA